jgi:hydroxymethylpyrimidine pyrophosphatase-like HAD family hydrolase
MHTAPLVAIDLDGTLLDPNGEITPRSVSAVHAAAAAGMRIVIATGRPPHMVAQLDDVLAGAVSHVVATNGSLISTFPTHPGDEPQLLHLLSFDIHRARRIVGDLRASDAGFGFALATDRGFGHEPGFVERMPAAVHEPAISDVLTIDGTVAFKLFAFHDRRSSHALLVELPPLVNPHDDAVHEEVFGVSHMGADAVEIGPASTDKCAGLRWLCEHLDVDRSDVIAIGDELNDLTMLRWAGRGIAMDNADPEVRAVADEIAPSNRDDGVAQILEALTAAVER